MVNVYRRCVTFNILQKSRSNHIKREKSYSDMNQTKYCFSCKSLQFYHINEKCIKICTKCTNPIEGINKCLECGDSLAGRPLYCAACDEAIGVNWTEACSEHSGVV